MAEDKKKEIIKLIAEGKEALEVEEKASLWGWQPFPDNRIKALNKKYKEWLERFVEVTDGSIDSYAIEQQIIITAREDGYYKIIQYWQQHINELIDLK